MNENIETNVQKLTPFTKILMTIGELPTSYLMSMTYYEQLIWFTKYLQEQVIPAVNTNAEAVEELQGLFTELQSYVNNYFDNLDVQEEINTKLDEMASDGSLTNLIKNYIDPIFNSYKQEIDSEVATQNQSIATQNQQITELSSRVNNLSQLEEGSTTGDAELEDIRVGFDGLIFTNAGNSVRYEDYKTRKMILDQILTGKTYDVKYRYSSSSYIRNNDGVPEQADLSGQTLYRFPVQANELYRLSASPVISANSYFYYVFSTDSSFANCIANSGVIGIQGTQATYDTIIKAPATAKYIFVSKGDSSSGDVTFKRIIDYDLNSIKKDIDIFYNLLLNKSNVKTINASIDSSGYMAVKDDTVKPNYVNNNSCKIARFEVVPNSYYVLHGKSQVTLDLNYYLYGEFTDSTIGNYIDNTGLIVYGNSNEYNLNDIVIKTTDNTNYIMVTHNANDTIELLYYPYVDFENIEVNKISNEKHVVFVSDIHLNSSINNKQRISELNTGLIKENETNKIDFVVINGDLVTNSSGNDIFPSMVALLDEYLDFPYFLTCGNHEMQTNTKFKSVTSYDKTYILEGIDYSFIMIDTFTDTSGSDVTGWLQEDISNDLYTMLSTYINSHKNCMLVSHYFDESLTNLSNLFNLTNVICGFMGHTHTSTNKVINGKTIFNDGHFSFNIGSSSGDRSYRNLNITSTEISTNLVYPYIEDYQSEVVGDVYTIKEEEKIDTILI